MLEDYFMNIIPNFKAIYNSWNKNEGIFMVNSLLDLNKFYNTYTH